jgi:hypothetical protein
MSNWIYQGDPIVEIDIKQYPAFVYRITNLIDGRFYIGYKQSSFTKTRQVKGKKKKYQAESDWRDYWSSSDDLKADVARLGEDKFSREILYFCVSKSHASYLELREQMDQRVLENPETNYNRIVNARISAIHIKKALPYIKQLQEQ